MNPELRNNPRIAIKTFSVILILMWMIGSCIVVEFLDKFSLDSDALDFCLNIVLPGSY